MAGNAVVARGDLAAKWAILCEFRAAKGLLGDGVKAMSYELFDTRHLAEVRAAAMRAKHGDVTYTVLPYPEAAKRAGI